MGQTLQTRRAGKQNKLPDKLKIPRNGKSLGLYVDPATAVNMTHEVSAAVCVLRRSLAAAATKGRDFVAPRGAEHLGDMEFWTGISQRQFGKDVEDALVSLASNHCLRQLLAAGDAIRLLQLRQSPCGVCVPTPDANGVAG